MPNVTLHIAVLYNPGLQNSRFILAGMISALLVLQETTVAAASMVSEKEIGTIEQLLMTPGGAIDIISEDRLQRFRPRQPASVLLFRFPPCISN